MRSLGETEKIKQKTCSENRMNDVSCGLRCVDDIEKIFPDYFINLNNHNTSTPRKEENIHVCKDESIPN